MANSAWPAMTTRTVADCVCRFISISVGRSEPFVAASRARIPRGRAEEWASRGFGAGVLAGDGPGRFAGNRRGDTLGPRFSLIEGSFLRRLRILVLLLFILAAAGGVGLIWQGRTVGQAERVRSAPIADVSSERLTTGGSVVGVAVSEESHAWFGIPYAEPPVGVKRWRAPTRPVPSTDTLDALQRRPGCIESNSRDTVDGEQSLIRGSEDCLYLNVWAPRFEPETVPKGADRLPVMVWVHGGQGALGFGGPLYDASLLASRHRLIVISVDYRLGPLGAFAHPSLLNEVGGSQSEFEPSGHFGLLDLIAALQWVRENVEVFGGDPESVTLAGASSGGSQVLSLMVAPPAQGLFQRAIVQSGSARTRSLAQAVHYRDAAEAGEVTSAREIVLRLLMADGTAPDRDRARYFADGLSPEATADYLRNQSPEDLFRAYLDPSGGQLLDFSGAFRDGVLVPDGGIGEALADLAPGESIPLLVGSNRDEAKLGLMQDPAQVRRTLDVFLRVRRPDQYEVLSAIQTALGRMEDVEGVADRIAARNGAPVYVYRFDWDEEPFYLGADLELLLGAAHGVELPFVFGQFQFDQETAARLLFNEENAPGRRFVSDSMMSYWAEFAYRGAPGRGRARALPLWEPWSLDPKEKWFMVFDTPESGGIRMSSDRTDERGIFALWSEGTAGWAVADRCEVFDKLLQSGPIGGLSEIDVPCVENLKTSDGGVKR